MLLPGFMAVSRRPTRATMSPGHVVGAGFGWEVGGASWDGCQDVHKRDAAQDNAPRRGGFRSVGAAAGQREVEGIGGRMWYELGQ